MLTVIFFVLVAGWQEPQVPLKPSDEFQLTVDYRFKTRPSTSGQSNINYDYQNDRIVREGGGGPLPYLVIKFKTLKLAEQESRVRVENNVPKTVLTKKVAEGDEFDLDLGYTDDMKDRVSAFEYNIYFLSAKKEPVSRVHLFIADDGTFFVNGEKRGKF